MTATGTRRTGRGAAAWTRSSTVPAAGHRAARRQALLTTLATLTAMAYDVESVRAHFPALKAGAAHFDGPGGSQVPDVVAEAVAGTLTSPIANRGSSRRPSATPTTSCWRPGPRWPTCSARDPRGHRLRPQHDPADLRRLPSAGQGVGAGRRGRGQPAGPRRQRAARGCRRPRLSARPCGGSSSTGRQRSSRVADVERVLSPSTRLVAVTGASNLLGTRPDLPAIAAAVHAAGALLYLDGVHLTPHASVDWSRSARTSTPARRTSSSGRTAAWWRPGPSCWKRCIRTSFCRRPMRCRSGSSSARCRTSCWPASRRRSTSTRRWTRAATGSRRERVLAGMAALEEHEDGLRAGWSAAWPRCPASRCARGRARARRRCC